MNKSRIFREWTGEELITFYKDPSKRFIAASINDGDMQKFIWALGVNFRWSKSPRIYFGELDRLTMEKIVQFYFNEFMIKLEKKTEDGNDYFFDFVLKNSNLFKHGGIFSEIDAALALRSELMGMMIYDCLSEFGDGIFKLDDYVRRLKNLEVFNKDIHKGVKYNVYKNQILNDDFGMMLVTCSMLFQGEMVNSDMRDFDSYCDVFEEYIKKTMISCGMDLNKEINERDFYKEMKEIVDLIIRTNENYFLSNFEL